MDITISKTKKMFIELMILVVIVVISVPLFRTKIAILFNNKGIDYCDIGEIDKAVSFFKKSLKIKPDPQVHCNLANVYREKGMLEESIIEYKKVLQLDPNYIQAYYGLAYSYEEKGMYKEVISYLEEAEFFDSHRAKKELEEFRFNYAISLFNEAADFYVEGNKSKAESKLKEVIELKPNFILAHKVLGDIKFDENLFTEAIAYYKKAIELGLSDASVYNLYNDIGIGYMRLENYSEALEYLRRAYELEPNNINILYSLASTLRDNRDFDEALERYRKLVELKFDYPNVHNDMAGICNLLGKTEEAEREYKNEVRIVKAQLLGNPGDIYSQNRLALAYNGLGQHEEAKKVIDSIIEKRPDYGEAFYTRAKIYESLKEIEKAVSDLERAKKLFSPRSKFIDNFALRLKTRSKDKEYFSNDITIYLRNGREIQGRLKTETDERIFLDVLVGNSFGTIAISRQDIKLLKKLK